MDKYLDETADSSDEETTKVISYDNNKQIWSGRDISLASTIMTYKKRLAGSISNPWNQQKVMNSNHAQSTEDFTIITMNES